ncbi:hypothetical protein EDC01DRAFT_467571 [Geopyxis carbonaria]|nr:hypothetical protein EDC01DRAFT_467571 [Geopyxis carbonaria]
MLRNKLPRKAAQQPKIQDIQQHSDTESTDSEYVIYPKNWDHSKGQVVPSQLAGSPGKRPEKSSEEPAKQALKYASKQQDSPRKATNRKSQEKAPDNDIGANKHSFNCPLERSTTERFSRSGRPLHKCSDSNKNFLCCSAQVRWLLQHNREKRKRQKNNSKTTGDEQSTRADDELSDDGKAKPAAANRKIPLAPKTSNAKIVIQSPQGFRRGLYHQAEALTKPVLNMTEVDETEGMGLVLKNFKDRPKTLGKAHLGSEIQQTRAKGAAEEKSDVVPRIQVLVIPPRNFNRVEYVVCNRIEGLQPLCFDPSEYEYCVLDSC